MLTIKHSLFALIFAIAVCLLSAQTSRNVYIVNNCKQPYYFDVVPGAAPYNPPSLAACTSSAQCITGSYCNTDAKVCFWNTPMPNNGNYMVAAGSSNSITFPYVNNGNYIQWGGNFGFCYNESCSASPSVCNSQGCQVIYGPVNLAEITMQKDRDDFYDISNIGGINVAMSITPKGIASSALTPTDPYKCGAPGSIIGGNTIAPSPWSLTPPFIHNIYVVGNSKTCTSDADCSGGQRCGLSNVPGRTPQFQLMCGNFYGYWTANAVCAQDAQNSLVNNPFQCTTGLQNGPFATTYGSMQQCDGTSGSGYAVNSPYVCGCVDWYKLTNGAVPRTTQNCTATNPIWQAAVLPHLTWLKNACPSCYTYPYDDMSSTFVCSNMVNGYNNLEYTITLCPAQ